MSEIEEKINEIALKYCPDYPRISEIESWEQLYAIESELIGINLANEDCHKMIKYLAKLLGYTMDDLFEIWSLVMKGE
jgi:hypothetical protein